MIIKLYLYTYDISMTILNFVPYTLNIWIAVLLRYICIFMIDMFCEEPNFVPYTNVHYLAFLIT